MPAPRMYAPELRDRAVRLMLEAQKADESLTLNAAVARTAPRVGVNKHTPRSTGVTGPGVTTADSKRVRELEAEVRELKRANEILRAASVNSTSQRNTLDDGFGGVV